jgi:glycolate oxidase
VQKVVRFCIANNLPYTPRGAGTGLSGGALAALGGVIISTKRLNKILEIDIENRCLRAQAGIANKRISDAVAGQRLHFAPDPSSQSVSTLGGNIAENSGGPHTLKYGVTVQHVLGITLVDTEGEVAELGGPVAGYPGYDLLGLIVGGEGTLGIVTEAWVKLTPLPEAVKTALVSFRYVRDATETVAAIISSGTIPAALEIMDRGILAALKAAFNLQFHPEAEALLLIEVDGGTNQVVNDLEAVERICAENKALEVRVAKDESERQELWKARKKGIGAMGRLAPTIVTHDGVIPRSKLPEMLDTVYEVAAKYNLGVANIFHAGDGNLHPCFYFDDREEGIVDRVIAAGEEVIKYCLELGGSITGEHGVGTEKLDLMPLMFSPENLALQAAVKSVFNDGSLCNPCKVLPNQKSCVEHQKRWRGVAW